MKKALLQVADTGPLESLVVMLQSVGYECYLPDGEVRDILRTIGCDTVLSINELVKHWGYTQPRFQLPLAHKHLLHEFDLFVDVKAHRNGPLIVKYWPHFTNKMLWYRINGGKPEHVIRADGFDCGYEVNPPCPVLTPNQWYKFPEEFCSNIDMILPSHKDSIFSKSYVCWPPFVNIDSYNPASRNPVDSPICLIHNFGGWGYGALLPFLQEVDVKVYGHNSPNGVVKNTEMPNLLSKALCYVHAKSNDAPGYALYEALAAGCPIICTRRLIWRCKMQELFIPGETCLVFDRETHDPLSTSDVTSCSLELKQNLATLTNPMENRRIGMNGRRKLLEIMWNEKRDQKELQEFLSRHFHK